MENTKSNKGYASEINVVAEMNTISILRAVRMDIPNCEFDIIIINTQVLANAIAKNPDALKEVGIGLWDAKTAPNYSKPTPKQQALGVRICEVTPPPTLKIKWR